MSHLPGRARPGGAEANPGGACAARPDEDIWAYVFRWGSCQSKSLPLGSSCSRQPAEEHIDEREDDCPDESRAERIHVEAGNNCGGQFDHRRIDDQPEEPQGKQDERKVTILRNTPRVVFTKPITSAAINAARGPLT